MTNKTKTEPQRVTIDNEVATITFIERRRPMWRYNDRWYTQRDWNRDWRSYNEEPRIYVSGGVAETVLDDLQNRRRRPWTLWKKMLPDVLTACGVSLNLEGLRWSKNAGCTMCPCSPGFVIQKQTIGLSAGNPPVANWDVWVKIKDAPSVDERKPARVI
jgi:hypothetical protein